MTRLNFIIYTPITFCYGIVCLVIGCLWLDDNKCENNKHLSTYLIVQGCLLLSVFLFAFLTWIALYLTLKSIIKQQTVTFTQLCLKLTVIDILLLIFYLAHFAWWIVGNVWLWSTHHKFCNAAYTMTFVYVVSGYVSIFIGCCGKCLFGFFTEQLTINNGTPLYRFHNPCAGSD